MGVGWRVSVVCGGGVESDSGVWRWRVGVAVGWRVSVWWGGE